MNSSWTEIEIQDLPPLKDDESCLLDMHSLLNVLSILHGELSLLGITLAQNEEFLSSSLQACREIIASLRNRQKTLGTISDLGKFRSCVERDLHGLMTAHPEGLADQEALTSCDNIRSVFAILEVRAREIMARQAEPEAWVRLDINQLRANFDDAFAAIEKNSKGRYRILHNLAKHSASDYFVQLNFESDDNDWVTMPPVFIDVMRDLIANARKYTPPGGSIIAGLYLDSNYLTFAVEDMGRGIPAEEIPHVVEFGRRGSNVGSTRTMGGGFGLTKAIFVTKQFKGRMWIASCLGQGTRVRIEIPRRAQT